MVTTLQFSVDAARCTRCGECVLDCPVRIITQSNGSLPAIGPDDEADCMQCQHCLAICPTGAITILGRDPADSLPLTREAVPDLDHMERLVRGRRSFRRYRDENVDPALLSRILAAVSNAPTGVNRRELTYHLIDDRDTMRGIRETVLKAVLAARDEGRLPEGAAYLHSVASRFFGEGRDILFRTAPHALIVSAPPDAPCPQQDVPLALAYFELLAQSAGLGTVWWGLLKMALEALPELKPLFGLPSGHEYYGMLFGVPAMRYARTVQRDGAAVVTRIAGA